MGPAGEYKWSPPYKKARTQLATRKYVQRCMRNQLEKKEIQINNQVGNSGVPTASGRVDPFQTYAIVQGTTDDSRLGNFIKRTKMVMRLRANTVAGSNTDTFRVVVVHDKQTNGATPAVLDILTSASVYSGFNGDNVTGYGGSRFRILKDSGPFSLNATVFASGVSTLVASRVWTWNFGPRGLGVCQFDASAGGITDIVSGEIFIVTISDNATAGLQCTSQLCYVDN